MKNIKEEKKVEICEYGLVCNTEHVFIDFMMNDVRVKPASIQYY